MSVGQPPPVDIGRSAARDAAAAELSRGRYEQESLLDRFWRSIQEFFSALLGGQVEGSLGGVAALAVLVVVLASLAVLLLWSLRRTSRAAKRRTAEVFDTHGLSADDHRDRAEQHARAGEWSAAIQERLRAVARVLEDREIVAVLPARTADELATAAGHTLPMLASRLTTATRIFDAVTYGESTGSSEDYSVLVDLDNALRVTEPVVPA